MQKLSEKKTTKITLGTKEWADSNVNCYFGCSNNCRYCYAKKMAIRFKRKTDDNWKVMVPNIPKINKNYLKRKGRIMFPTSHDITLESLNGCEIVLQKLLESGNNVLITTKPNLICIKSLCKKFKNYKNLIQFRFTITSMDDKLLEFWEPGAPSFEERFNSLKHAYNLGYKTSISIEPFLDLNPLPLIDMVLTYVTESIWIGKMNYIDSNKNLDTRNKKYFEIVRRINSKSNLKFILSELENYPKSIIRIKDSIENYLN